MTSWMEIEKQFRELETALQYSRVDGQWGDAGEYWRIAGTDDPYSRKRFEAVARIAGEKLRSVLEKSKDTREDLLLEADPVRLWYKGIWHISKNFKYDFPGSLLDDKGNTIGRIHAGHIDRIVEASAIFCIELSSSFPDKNIGTAEIIDVAKEHGKFKIFWNKYGVGIVVGVIGTVLGGIILAIILG